MRALNSIKQMVTGAAVVLLIAVVFGAPAAQAGTASTAAARTATVMLNGTSYRVAASTAAKLHSGHPQSLTSAERAALGMTKPASANQAGSPTLQKASTPGTRPNAVSRCNGITVCIEVYGSGYYISAWDSQWYLSPNAYSCDSAWDWWGNFSYYAQSNVSCGYGPDYAYWSPARDFPGGSAQSYFEDDFTYSPAVNFTIHG